MKNKTKDIRLSGCAIHGTPPVPPVAHLYPNCESHTCEIASRHRSTSATGNSLTTVTPTRNRQPPSVTVKPTPYPQRNPIRNPPQNPNLSQLPNPPRTQNERQTANSRRAIDVAWETRSHADSASSLRILERSHRSRYCRRCPQTGRPRCGWRCASCGSLPHLCSRQATTRGESGPTRPRRIRHRGCLSHQGKNSGCLDRRDESPRCRIAGSTENLDRSG